MNSQSYHKKAATEWNRLTRSDLDRKFHQLLSVNSSQFWVASQFIDFDDEMLLKKVKQAS